MRWSFLKRSEAKVSEFKKGRKQESDEDFLHNLSISDDCDEREIVLAVRRAVASVGRIDSLYIRADDRALDELSALPVWDSMDWMALVMALEEELGIAISDKEAEQIRFSDFSVRSCVRDVLAIVRRTQVDLEKHCPFSENPSSKLRPPNS